MTTFDMIHRLAARALLLLAVGVMGLALPVWAGPGAHDPDGEHLDAPGFAASSRASQPRLETHSETFELVGYLREGELSLMINRYETNAPVLGAKVQVASGSLETTAKFHADRGDYTVGDPAFLKMLGTPGTHPLIFTVVAGADTDLLEGTLRVEEASAHDHPHGHSHALEYGLAALALLVAMVLAAGALRKRRERTTMRAGGLS